MIITFQEFEKHEQDRAKWLGQAISQYMKSDRYLIALEADQYEMQLNTRILNFEHKIYDITGVSHKDFTCANHQLASNFFHRLNTQRVSYSLGNGVSFAGKRLERNPDMTQTITDPTKEALGSKFDRILYNVAYHACEHGECYCFYNDGMFYEFPMTEFLPFMDEMTGQIRAGARFWCLEWKKRPVVVDLYEEDGYSRYMTKKGKYGLGALELIEKKKAYKQTVQVTEADGEEVVGEENYATIPIFVMYGKKTKQSTLIGMKQKIDAYDMIQSGYANDLSDCAQMYWLIDNAAGMDEEDVARLRDRMLLQHIVVADNQNSTITPYSQDVPYNSREACLERLKKDIYSDFGALDVQNIGAGANLTATEIRAAYQTLDEEADDLEYQVEEFIQQILHFLGIEDSPTFDRNRIANEREETDMVLLAANYLDDETILKKLPFITVDEVDTILARRDKVVDRRLQTEENEEDEQ